MRRATLIAVLCAAIIVPVAHGHAGAPLKWRWVVIERQRYVSSLPESISMTIVTGPLLEWPVGNKDAVFPSGTADNEQRVRLRVVGPPAAIGRSIGVAGLRLCTTAGEYEGDRVTTTSRRYGFKIKPAQYLVLPGNSPNGKDRVSCTWSLAVSSPTTGKGVHRATLELSAFSPVEYAMDAYFDRYDAQECSFTIGTAGASQQTCRSIGFP